MPPHCFFVTSRGLQVQFAEEPGHGAGVVREWLTLLAPRLFSPELGLFVRCGGNPLALLPSSGECGGRAVWFVLRRALGRHSVCSTVCICREHLLHAAVLFACPVLILQLCCPASLQLRVCSPTTKSTCEWQAG